MNMCSKETTLNEITIVFTIHFSYIFLHCKNRKTARTVDRDFPRLKLGVEGVNHRQERLKLGIARPRRRLEAGWQDVHVIQDHRISVPHQDSVGVLVILDVP